jgi:hypothetical protein
MWAVVVALGAVYGLVRVAVAKPDIRRALGENKLAKLKKKLVYGGLTRSEAEDGAVLARRAGEAAVERKFKTAAAFIKQHQK